MFKNYTKIIGWIISIIILLLALFGGISLIKPPKTVGVIKTDTVIDTVYVSSKGSSDTYTPVPKTEVITINDTIFIDNFIEVFRDLTESEKQEIAENFYTKRHYTDSLKTEYGYVTIDEYVWKNKIYSRSYSYDFSIPHIKETTTNTVKYEPNRFKMYLGASMAVDLMNYGDLIVNSGEYMPQLYVGSQYRFGDSHYVIANYDIYRKDLRVGYMYDKGRWSFTGEYSSMYEAFQLGGRFYIFK